MCRSCFEECRCWGEIEQTTAQENVVSLLKMNEEYDDIFVPRYIVQETLLERYPFICASKGQANLWIDSSIQAGLIVETRHCEKKREKVLALPKYEEFADWPYAQDDNSEIEWCMVILLWLNGGTMERTLVNDALYKIDPQRMSNPFMRSLVMRNAESKKWVFIDRTAQMQVVCLTKDVRAAIEADPRIGDGL